MAQENHQLGFSAVYEAIRDKNKGAFWQGIAIIGAVAAGFAILLLSAFSAKAAY